MTGLPSETSGELAGVEPDIGERGRLARAVATAVADVPGVRLLAGRSPEVATQHRGGKVLGVQLGADLVTAQVAVSRLPLAPVTRAVHVAARSVLDAAGDRRPVQVVVAGLDAADLPRSAGIPVARRGVASR